MKAADILQQYQNGQRTFQRLNLRGLNFTGKDLSRADFSHCQIQGANFKQANLTGANFTGAKAGLQKRWIVTLLLISFLFAGLSSLGLALSSYYLERIFTNSHLDVVSGIIAITLLLSFLILISLGGVNSIIIISAIVMGILVSITTAGLFKVAVGSTIGSSFLISMASVAIIGITIALIVIGLTVKTITGRVILFITIILFLGGTIRFAQEYYVQSYITFCISIIVISISFYLSYRTLKDETRDPWLRNFAIVFAAIGGTSFYGATLTDANFTGATLKNTNFNQAILTRTCFKDTVKLNLARAGKTILANPTVRDLLINPSNGCGINLFKADLRGANLESANLEKANLSQADISEATFQYANLKEANLTEINGVKTNFSNALLTGACLENWNIDATTILEDVECQYVYLLNNKQERRPSSGNFQGNEFTKLFEEVFDTVDLIFRDGVDWKAFLLSMKEIQVQNEETPLEVQSIENKGDGVIVVKVKVSPDANKEKIHQDFNAVYQVKLAEMEAKYKGELNARDVEIQSYRRENGNMQKTIEILANRPTINVSNSQFGGGFAGRDYDGNVENIQ